MQTPSMPLNLAHVGTRERPTRPEMHGGEPGPCPAAGSSGQDREGMQAEPVGVSRGGGDVLAQSSWFSRPPNPIHSEDTACSPQHSLLLMCTITV